MGVFEKRFRDRQRLMMLLTLFPINFKAQAMCQSLIGHVTCALVYKGLKVSWKLSRSKTNVKCFIFYYAG